MNISSGSWNTARVVGVVNRALALNEYGVRYLGWSGVQVHLGPVCEQKAPAATS